MNATTHATTHGTTQHTADPLSLGETFERFAAVIARLRAPDGCPWDREQTHASIARNMIEEAYEAVDAIERADTDDLREELGDVLLQVVLQSQIAAEAGEFALAEVIADITDKMIRRHPHVFGDEVAFAAAHLTPEEIERIHSVTTADEVLGLWDAIKLVEKQRKAQLRAAKGTPIEGLLDGVPAGLPALMQAQDISRKAVSVGFEWEDLRAVWQQVASEIEEYREAEPGSEHAAEEFGDILFSLVNVARKQGIDAESALRLSCRKFRSRWAMMETYANQAGCHISSYSTEDLEGLWQRAKRALDGAAGST
ncbi:MAG: nucleoside triphosphate pyrophosphohydrolase [Coriobacteriales bacterium]|jgi:tetrapyrrole methylase family protein/MazG family protein|nr:nucleoside triphosphate pyrophosphohydrolase [Coriobacteriales bacterium]